MKPALSTIACPEWTLDQVAAKAEEWGYLGVELRSFGYGSREFACDPALTAPTKTRAMFDRVGVEIACIATSARFDDPVTPPIIGEVLADKEKGIRETKAAIDLASRLGCPFVRVFAFEIIGRETRAKALDRICERLGLAADAARNSGIRLLIENGGSFGTATDLAEIIDRVANPLLAASYSIPAAVVAGDDPLHGLNVLDDSIAIVKVGDYKHGHPCALGQGIMPIRAVIQSLAASNYDGWVVYEHPAAWLGGGNDAAPASGAKTLFEWAGRREVAPPARPRAKV